MPKVKESARLHARHMFLEHVKNLHNSAGFLQRYVTPYSPVMMMDWMFFNLFHELGRAAASIILLQYLKIFSCVRLDHESGNTSGTAFDI